MSKTWKWVLGIVLVLMVIAAIMGAIMFMSGFMRDGVVAHGMFQPNVRGYFDPHSQMMGGSYEYARPGYMMDGGYRFDGRISMMRGFIFFPLFGRLIPLALLGLLVYGAYRLGMKKSNAPQVSAVAASSEAVVESSESEMVDVKTCKKCGGLVQEDWRNCPYCGTKQ